MKILILATKGLSTNYIVNRLQQDLKGFELHIILEEKIAIWEIIKGRIKKKGLFNTISQILFLLLVIPILKIEAKRRIEEVKENSPTFFYQGFDSIPVESINSSTTYNLIQKIKPEIILLNGTRIMSKQILERIKTPIINIHTGITPQYRGVHGGYWSLVKNDQKHFGTTIHFVDAGIDTGKVILQKSFSPNKNDNFTTYYLTQYEEIYNNLVEVLKYPSKIDILTKKTDISNLYYHPTIWEYIYFRITKSIK